MARDRDTPQKVLRRGNLKHDLPERAEAEAVSTLCEGRHARIERIVSTGQCSPPGFWYDQAEHELVVVLQGSAGIELEDGTVTLAQGDWLELPAHVRHRVAWTSPQEPTIWLAVFYT